MKYMNVARRYGAVVVGTLILSSTAMAATTTEAVNGAISDGTTVVQLVVGGVIALASLAFGLGMMKSWLSK